MYAGLEDKKKATPGTLKRIIAAILGGNNERDAAVLGGIDQDTLIRWKNESAEFAEAIAKAHADFKSSLLGVIQKAATNDWKAAAWFASRKFKQEYSERSELSGPEGEPLSIVIKRHQDSDEDAGAHVA